MSPKVIKILLAEDDPGDVMLIKESFKNSRLYVNITHVPDGQECVDYLNRTEKYSNAETPDLILLDLNMPKKDGREVLKIIKAEEKLKKIPVIILTTSEADADIENSYGLGANCFITKPIEFNQFQEVVRQIADFWFTIVKLPDGH